MHDLNSILAISLAILAIVSLCLFVVVIPIALQFSRTLSSAQHLIDTINDDFEPTVKDIKQSISGAKNLIQKSSVSVRSSITEAGVFVISSAYGALAALKEYLSTYKTTETSYNNKREGKNAEVQK